MKYLFKIAYYRPHPTDTSKDIEIFESIVAETVTQALQFWAITLQDEAINFHYLVREDPILAVLPKEGCAHEMVDYDTNGGRMCRKCGIKILKA